MFDDERDRPSSSSFRRKPEYRFTQTNVITGLDPRLLPGMTKKGSLSLRKR
jgi:hypothetical protein